MINNSNGNIIGIYKDKIFEDAVTKVREGSLSIDTARYDIAKNIRAFGVLLRAEQFTGCGCCADGGTEGILTLFVLEGNTIKPILQDLTISQWKSIQCNESDRSVERIDKKASITISVEKSSTFGYYDLSIAATSWLEFDFHKTNSKRKILRHIIHYDGNRYSIGGWNEAFSKWWEGSKY